MAAISGHGELAAMVRGTSKQLLAGHAEGLGGLEAIAASS